MAGIKDVALKAGVSISTVSNVMTGNKAVSEDLVMKVQDAIVELNYKVHPMASALRSNRSNTVGVIVTSFKSVFIGQLLKGIQDTFIDSDFIVSVFESNNDLEKEKKYLTILTDSMVDGIIILSQADSDCPEDHDYIFSLKNLKKGKHPIPVVSLEKTFGEHGLDSIVSDNRNAGYIATKHLIDLGHRQIACITGPMNMEMCRYRLQGYQEALSEFDLSFQPELVKIGDFSPVMGYTCMRELVSETEITAVFAMNDQSGIGAIKAIKDSGLRVPQDIAVMGFDNIFPSTLINPSLSTINVAKYQMGVAAAKRIIQRINDEPVDSNLVLLKTQLIVRKSTDLDGDDSWDLYGW